MISVDDFPNRPCPRYPAIIPAPLSVTPREGVFHLTRDAAIAPGDATLRGAAAYLAEVLAPATGFALPVSEPGCIALRLDKRLGAEAYELTVSRDAVDLVGGDVKGVLNGVQTLRQLLPLEVFSRRLVAGLDWTIPCVKVEDKPRFQWRGLMLDVGRHFFGKDTILGLLDAMALHKLNVFHFHLTEDQGWRVAIDKYPRLAQLASTRGSTPRMSPAGAPDGVLYGPYCYSKDELREIVAHAAKLGICVVPELEMPGHSLAALSAYPELSCAGGPFEVASAIGVFKDIYCAGKDATFAFLTDVIDELLDIFPGEFFHIGGDECPKDRWKLCPHCQGRIAKEGLKDEVELQAWFIKRVAAHLGGRGRRMVGWDDILEGELPADAVVMPWRNLDGAAAARGRGLAMVLTPGSHCYFDYSQAARPLGETEPLAVTVSLPLEKVYGFDPAIPALGVQGNVWTEFIHTPEKLEYMTFPRAAALAEVAWSEPARKDYPDFLGRLDAMTRRYDFLGINYRPLDRAKKARRGKKPRLDLRDGPATAILGKLVLGGPLRDWQGRLIRESLWKGPKALSARATLHQEGASLCFRVDVTDNAVVACPKDERNLCAYDCVELFVDFHPTNGDAKDFYQLLLSPDGRVVAARNQFPPAFKAEAEISKDGYTVAGSFTSPVDAEASIGFDLALDDVGEDSRRSIQLLWAGEADNCANKTNFGMLILK